MQRYLRSLGPVYYPTSPLSATEMDEKESKDGVPIASVIRYNKVTIISTNLRKTGRNAVTGSRNDGEMPDSLGNRPRWLALSRDIGSLPNQM